MKPRPLRRFAGYALIAAVWLVLFGLVGFFALAFAIYLDLKSPDRSHLVAGTRVEAVAHLVFAQNFWPMWQVQPGSTLFDPSLIYVPKPGPLRFRSTEFDTVITFTGEGLRQQAKMPPPDARDLVVVTGDSFAMGWGVGDAETFSALLASRHGHATVNASVSSYGTARELLRLRRLGLLERAKVLVIQFCPNDAPENREFLTLGDGRVSRDPRAAWEKLQSNGVPEVSYLGVIGGTFRALRNGVNEHTLSRFSRDLWRGSVRFTRNYSSAFPEMAREFLAVIDSFPELAGKPIVVTELKTPEENSEFLPDLRKRVGDRPNIRVVTLELEPEDYYRFDPHLRARGHEKVAEQLDRAIREHAAAHATTPR